MKREHFQLTKWD